MNTVRLKITLPSDVAEAIKGGENKSAFIAEAIRYRLKMEKQKKLIAALREGYAATRTEDRKLSKEWDSTVGDGID
jgi:metal-responsive CopG/Arc/MetJ family transcriptional regulator